VSELEPLTRADQTVVIVGGGLAGLRVAEGLRGAEFPGRIVMVSDEPHEPYDRPPLSKAVLETEGHEDNIELAPGELLASLKLDLRLGEPAAALDRARGAVKLQGGAQIPYDRLVLATGSRVRTLPLLPPGAPNVCYLRGLDDALALRAELAPGRKVAVIGGGVIGMEVAATARTRGCEVVVIEAADRPMARTSSPVVSRYLEARHRATGVDLRLGVMATAARWDGPILRLQLSSGEAVETETAVVGVGVLANVELARDAGLEIRDGGVLTDGYGATSDPLVYAAGEVAAHFNAYYGRHGRQETWNHAAAHGEHVGRSMVTPAEPYCEITSFWSDQFDINLQAVGDPVGGDEVVRGDPASGSFLVFNLSAGRIVGVSAINSVRQLRIARRLIGAAPDPVALGDPAVELSSLV